jgi:putative membrane protein
VIVKPKLKLLAMLFCSAVVVFGFAGCTRERGAEAAREDRSQSISPAEQEFMTEAAHANLAEIEIARIALQKSDDIDVHEYARTVQSDHMSALADLSDLMKERNLPEPASPFGAAAQDIARANLLTGPEFDREFINMMVADHQRALEMFRSATMTAENSDLKEYIEEVLPKLEMHLEKAQRLQSRLFALWK